MKGSILIVDDEPSVRDSLRRWFQDDGFEVGTAEGANDALTRLADRRWDLALVDIRMRGTDGIELQRRMRDIDPELIVIIMTGYASVDTAVAALKNGAYDYITKPLDPTTSPTSSRTRSRTAARRKRTCACATSSPRIPCSRRRSSAAARRCNESSTPSRPSARPTPRF